MAQCSSGVSDVAVSPRRSRSRFPACCSRRHTPRAGRVFRPEQGPVPELRLPGAEDRTLRHLLLPGGGSRRPGWRRGWPSAGTPGSRRSAQPRAARPSAARSSTRAVRTSGRRTRSKARWARAPAASPKPTSGGSSCRWPARSQPTDHVLGHELVHAFQYDITNTNVSSGNAGALGLPLWFIEGMAEYLSIGPVDAAHGDVDAGSGPAREAAGDRRAGRSALLPLSLRPRPVGLHRRPVTATRWSATCCAPAARRARGYKRGVRGRAAASRPKELSKEWHDAAVRGVPADRRDHQDARGDRARR